MIEKQPSSSPSHAKTKKVSIQERSVHVGDFIKNFLPAEYLL